LGNAGTDGTYTNFLSTERGSAPQRLKPVGFVELCGTSELVPFPRRGQTGTGGAFPAEATLAELFYTGRKKGGWPRL